jgi:hypothetical protein
VWSVAWSFPLQSEEMVAHRQRLPEAFRYACAARPNLAAVLARALADSVSRSCGSAVVTREANNFCATVAVSSIAAKREPTLMRHSQLGEVGVDPVRDTPS